VNKIPDRSEMIGKFFRERQRFSHQASNALPQRVVAPFNMTGFAAGFVHRAMSFRRQHLPIRRPEIRITHGTLPIHPRQGLPQPLGPLPIPAAEKHPHDFLACHVFGQPQPLLIAFVPDKGPQFVSFEGQAAWWFVLHRDLFWHRRIFLLHIALQPASRHASHPTNTFQRNPLQQQLINQSFGLGCDQLLGRVGHKLPPTGLTFKALFARMDSAVFDHRFGRTDWTLHAHSPFGSSQFAGPYCRASFYAIKILFIITCTGLPKSLISSLEVYPIVKTKNVTS
jgi:hypothetical protein